MNNVNLVQELTAEIPKVTWFLSIRQSKLAEITNTDEARWTRYFQGVHLGEKALNQLAQRLGMEPHTLLLAITLRRKQELEKSKFSSAEVAKLA